MRMWKFLTTQSWVNLQEDLEEILIYLKDMIIVPVVGYLALIFLLLTHGMLLVMIGLASRLMMSLLLIMYMIFPSFLKKVEKPMALSGQ